MRAILTPEIYQLVRSGALELTASEKLGYEWQLDDEWNSNSLQMEGVSLDSDGKVNSKTQLPRGFPFGPAQVLSKEENLETRGTKLIWNSAAVFQNAHVFDLEFSLEWFHDGKSQGHFIGNQKRIYPQSLSGVNAPQQYFREIIRISSPNVIAGLSWLTIRFIGSEEDLLWLYSPAINKTRQLTGSNRSDTIYRSTLSPDDLLLWSGKPELLDARTSKIQEALVPFTSLAPSTLQGMARPDKCAQMKLSTAAESAMEGIGTEETEVRRFAPGVFPLPAETVWVPREVWRVELSPKDPFSQYARQALYIDALSQLPIFKVIYNRSGQLWKFGIGILGYADWVRGIPPKGKSYPYYSFILLLDQLKNDFSTLEYRSLTFCDEPVPNLELGDFDPKKLVPEPQAPKK